MAMSALLRKTIGSGKVVRQVNSAIGAGFTKSIPTRPTQTVLVQKALEPEPTEAPKSYKLMLKVAHREYH